MGFGYTVDAPTDRLPVAGTGVIDEISVPSSQIECTIFITASYKTRRLRLYVDIMPLSENSEIIEIRPKKKSTLFVGTEVLPSITINPVGVTGCASPQWARIGLLC